jgi:hypothetical protein
MTARTLKFGFITRDGVQTREIAIGCLIVAGWTGRDRKAMEAHMDELEALGVARPKETPVFYNVSAARLTQAHFIEATGEESSGEVEFLLVAYGGETWVGIASDHTDRKVETYDITVSKQMCDKPVGDQLWRLADVLPHWDRLRLKSEIRENGAWRVYQQGTVTAMLHPEDLIERYRPASGARFDTGMAMLGGTLPAKGGIRPAGQFRYSLHDPVLNRSIVAQYDVRLLSPT